MTNARAFWSESAGCGRILEERLPPAGDNAVRVQTRYTAISRGTESLIWQGRVPESEYQRMRCPHQGGNFPFPVKYGYCNVGRVTAGPAEWLGQSVFCLYPHQTEYVVPARDVRLIPEGVPEERAVLAANLETAMNALWDARPLLGDRITVVGAGVVGLLCCYLARGMGMDVELVDLRASRESLAQTFGASFALPARARTERDLVFHASGKPEGLITALGLAGEEGTVIELSWFGDQLVSLPLGERFHPGRLTLRSSQVGRVSPRARERYRQGERLSLALELCADPRLDALIDDEVPFERLPTLVAELCDPKADVLCRRVRYG